VQSGEARVANDVRTFGPQWLNSLNRRMRTRTYGGVAGEDGQPSPMPIPSVLLHRTVDGLASTSGLSNCPRYLAML